MRCCCCQSNFLHCLLIQSVSKRRDRGEKTTTSTKAKLENDAQVRRRYCRFILELLAPIFDGVFSLVKQNNWCFHRKLIFRQLHSCQLLDSLLTEVSWSCFSLSLSLPHTISFHSFSLQGATHTHAHSLPYTRTHCRTLSITLTCICSNTAMPPSLEDCLSPLSCTAPAQIHTYTRAWNFSYTPGPQKSNSTAWLECVAHYNAGRLCIDTSWDRWFVKISVKLCYLSLSFFNAVKITIETFKNKAKGINYY